MNVLTAVELPGLGPRRAGKVRDIYLLGGHRLLIATDRISAFDRVVGAVPRKGQVLNQLSAWWFQRTRDILENHLVEVPDPNVSLVREARPVPLEVVVRGYLTGSTSTSLWTLYRQGVQRPYGVELPPGMRQNDPLPFPVVTPTTKAIGGEHDQPVTPEEALARGLVDRALWERLHSAALALFARGQQVAARAGLILVDTKYEFGLLEDRLLLIDELHTPDSSRYWEAAACTPGRPLESYDKEPLRLWLAEQGYRGQGPPPPLPEDLRQTLSRRYVALYERLTGQPLEEVEEPAEERIRRNLERFLARARSS